MRITVKDGCEARAIVQTTLPVSMVKRLKIMSVERGETMQDIIARAVEKEMGGATSCDDTHGNGPGR